MVLPIFFEGFTMVLPTPLVLDLFSCNGPEPAHAIFFSALSHIFASLHNISARYSKKSNTYPQITLESGFPTIFTLQ